MTKGKPGIPEEMDNQAARVNKVQKVMQALQE